ncbi:unnamed protein product [Lactuca saligna]|uniref:Uncharacterized protein n=1 Tax=Lactuca saligna TaxID=75948 RepID=A0AA35YCM8_LACSI|nr:unnamed protein product [Lactuca saligna]
MLMKLRIQKAKKMFHDEEEEEEDETEKLKRKDRDETLNESMQVARKAEEKEKAEREAQVTLESRKLLFPLWTLEALMNEAINNPSQNCFVKVANVPPTNNGADHLLFSFYIKHMKPQYETSSAKKITVVKVLGPIETDRFPNARFKVARGATSQVCGFTVADVPCLNPYDWILLLNLLLKEEKKYEPVVSHLKNMLVSYIQEVGKMDIEIASIFKQKPVVFPKENP